MTVNETTDPDISPADDPQRGLAHKNRGLRFSDPEWEEVKQAAQAHDMTPAEFVRDRILELVRRPSGAASAALPPHLTPLIERTFRYTYMLATKMRDDMTATDRRDELETLIAEARKLQDELQHGLPE